jgi:quinol monooxygenase YgiN
VPTVVIAGHMKIDPTKRSAALEAGRPQIEGALAEPGCEAYAWTADPYDDAVLHVFEQWTDVASLADHLAGPWYRGMLEVLANHGIRDAQVLKYRVDLAEPVYDPDGRPRADFFTG